MVTLPLFINLTCSFSNFVSLLFNDVIVTAFSNSCPATARCRHKTNFRIHVPFTVQYYNLHIYPLRTLSTCVLQPSNSKPNVRCTVQFATCMVCGLTAGSSCVIGSYVRACGNIYICCDLSRSVELMVQTANVSFLFKV